MQRMTLMSFALLLLIGILLSGVVVVLATPEALQPEPEVDIWMSTTVSGGPVLRFPAGTTDVYAVMRYSNFSNTTAQVTLRDDLGVTLFQNAGTYTGNNTQSFKITGDQVFMAYWDHINDHAGMTKILIDQALITDTNKITTTVQAAMSEATLTSAGLQGIRRFSLPSSIGQHITNALAALDQMVDYGTEATTAGKSIEQILALIQQMQQETDTVLEEIHQAEHGSRVGNSRVFLPIILKQQTPGVIQPSNRTIPETPGCDQNLEPRAFTTNVDMMNSQGQFLPAASIEWITGNPDDAKYLDLIARPSSIYVQSVTLPSVSHTSLITATVRDARCISIQDGAPVSFTTNDPALGVTSPQIASTFTDARGRSGLAQTQLTAGSNLGSGYVIVTATVGSAVGARQVTLIGGPSSIQVSPADRYLQAGGLSTRVVATVRDAFNRNVGDGTPVTFSITPSEAGFIIPNRTTEDGIASTSLSPQSWRGPATVIATAGTVTGSAPIAIVGPTHAMTITAVPDTIVIGSVSAYADIHIQAVDDAGFPAPDNTKFDLEIFDPTLGYFQEGTGPNRNFITLAIRSGQATAQLLPQEEGLTGSTEICAQGQDDPVESCTTVTFVHSQ